MYLNQHNELYTIFKEITISDPIYIYPKNRWKENMLECKSIHSRVIAIKYYYNNLKYEKRQKNS